MKYVGVLLVLFLCSCSSSGDDGPELSSNFSYAVDGAQVALTNQSSGTIDYVVWSYGDGMQSIDYHAAYEYPIRNLQSSYSVSLTVYDPQGGSSASTQSVAMNCPQLTPNHIYDSGIQKWRKHFKEWPVHYFIDLNGFPSKIKPWIQEGLNNWYIGNGLGEFVEVQNPSEADLILPVMEATDFQGAFFYYDYDQDKGYVTYDVKSSWFTTFSDQQMYEFFRSITLHEMGHGLGSLGHPVQAGGDGSVFANGNTFRHSYPTEMDRNSMMSLYCERFN